MWGDILFLRLFIAFAYFDMISLVLDFVRGSVFVVFSLLYFVDFFLIVLFYLLLVLRLEGILIG